CPASEGADDDGIARDRRAGGFTAARRLGLVFLLASLCLLASQAGAADPVPPSQPAAQPSPAPPVSSWMKDKIDAIAGNPGAVDVKPGIGLLGRTLGFGPD